MATSANPKSSTLAEDVDKELTCAICLSRFETPKVLPCLHTYCKNCLENLLKKSRKHDQITCPQCNGEFPLPEGGIEGFKTHFTFNNLLELLQVHEASENKTSAHDIRCESELDENPAVARCTECCCYLCESCHANHKKQRFTKDHQVLSFDEIKRSDKKTGAKSLRKIQHCGEHKQQELVMFCKTCRKVICVLCSLGRHRKHDCSPVQDIRPEIQQQLEDLLQQVQAKETEFLSHKQYAENVHSINGSTATACKRAVNQRFSILAEALEARRAALVAELDHTHETEEKQLNAEVESLKLTLIKLSSSIRFCRQLLDNGSDVDVVSLSEEATQSLSGLKETKWDRHAVKPTLLHAVLDPELEKNIKGFGTVVHTIRPEDIVIQMPHTSYTNKEVTIKVQLSPEISEKGHSVPSDMVNIDIKHEDNTPVPCVLQSDPSLNAWTISCTPKKAGAYKVSVRVADGFTKESPMTLRVTTKKSDASLDQQATTQLNASPGPIVPFNATVGTEAQGIPSTTTSEATQEISELSPDALALLKKIPEGDIQGVEYNPEAGTAMISCQSKDEVEDRISKFQVAYQKILSSRRLKAGPVEVPPALDGSETASLVTAFNHQYNQTVFTYHPDLRVIKVVSVSSRQFDQAKKQLLDRLHSREGSTEADMSGIEVILLTNGRKLTLKKANIVEENVHIIVNAANGQLKHWGGVAGALNKASHGQLQRYSDSYMQQRGHVPVGHIAVTHGGGALNCHVVIHAVGPDHTFSQSECKQLLAQAIRCSFFEAEKYDSESIAFPAISSGIFGVSKDLVAQTMINTILNFKFNKNPPVLSDIRIVIIDHPTYSCFAHHFRQKQAALERAVKPEENTGVTTGEHTPQNSTPQTSQSQSHDGLSRSTSLPDGEPTTKPPYTRQNSGPPQSPSSEVSPQPQLVKNEDPHGHKSEIGEPGDKVIVMISSLPSGATSNDIQQYFKAQGKKVEVLSAVILGDGNGRIELSGLTAEEIDRMKKKRHRIKWQIVYIKFQLPPPSPTLPEPLTDTKTDSEAESSILEASGLPADIDEETLTMYFETSRAGGCSGAVEECSFTTPDKSTARVKFKSPEVTAQILSKADHTIFGAHVQLQYVTESSGDQQEIIITGKRDHRSKSPSRATAAPEECSICMEKLKNPAQTKCGHKFCSQCLNTALQYSPYCPTCRKALRRITGNQPPGGTMTERVVHSSLPGYPRCKTTEIVYVIPGGTQGQEHPNPGRRYTGTTRYAYLPDNYEGREVLALLRKAFRARLTFTVGTSVTSGAQNTVVWNDIHHKTSMSGGSYGYPDPTYLQRVKEDLIAKGIVPDSSRV